MGKINFTAGRVDGFKCPADKQQAFLWDSNAKGLGLRATPAGKPTYIFQSRIDGKTTRLAIGSPSAWTIDQAREKARALQRMIDEGKDPRNVKRDALAEKAAQRAALAEREKALAREALTVAQVWTDYLEKRRPFWGELHYQNHLDKAQAGGVPSKRRGHSKKLTTPGPLAALMPLTLKDLDQQTIEAWAFKEGQTRPTSARLAWRLLKVFLNWCMEQPEYASLVPGKNAAQTKKAREALGKETSKRDVLQKAQLKMWFASVRKISNPTISVFLQVLLLSGARLNEVLNMHWEDINFQWKGININDKVEGEREIPLTPYVESLISTLPRRNQFVFASARALRMDSKNLARRERKSAAKGMSAPVGPILETSATGRISEPNTPHTRACRAVGIEGLTLHGLRRSFASLTEWLEVPAGVVAQIQGHKPSATREKHYIVRPLELLALHHNRIEAWMLEQAGIAFHTKAAPAALRTVA